MKQQVAVRHLPDAGALSRSAARLTAEILQAAVLQQGYATLVLSGGSTPRQLYGLLASEQYRNSLPWEQLFFFWGDERCVPSGHQDSNYGMAFDSLLSRVPAVTENIYPIPVELGLQEAAVAYEALLQKFFAGRGKTAGVGFDLALLGIGLDGHTASIFPASPALDDERWVAAVQAPAGTIPRNRVTLTPALINRSDQVLFLAGAEKKEIVRLIFEQGGPSAAQYPAAHIRATGTTSVFLADGNVQK